MTHPNVELAQRAFAALAEGGVEGLLPFIDEDFEMETPAQFAAEPDTYRGHEGIRRWFASFYEVMDEVRLEPYDFQPMGEQVTMVMKIVARGRTTGLELTQETVALGTFVEEKLTRLEFFSTFEEAEQAAG